MKILKENPPVYQKILDSGMRPHSGVIYTYSDTIYNPSGIDIPDYLMRHEETHSRQQGDEPDKWWMRYLRDQYFRIEQEAEAYAAEYDFICQFRKDRNQRSRILMQLATSLAGPIYGSVIGTLEAYKIIQDKAKTK